MKYNKTIGQIYCSGEAVKCGTCHGHGLLSDYGNGDDFYGAKECPDCASGYQWKYPSGTLARYYAGPLVGKI